MSMGSHFPIIAIELVMVFGGALLFGWWQLRSIKQDQRKAAEKKRAQSEADAPGSPETDHKTPGE